MAKIGSYTLRRALARSTVAEAWLGTDPAGQGLTVVVLDDSAKRDNGKRSSFLFAINFIERSEASSYQVIGTDTTARRPWIAFAGEGEEGPRQFFGAMGIHYTPVEGTQLPPSRDDTTMVHQFSPTPPPEPSTVVHQLPVQPPRQRADAPADGGAHSLLPQQPQHQWPADPAPVQHQWHADTAPAQHQWPADPAPAQPAASQFPQQPMYQQPTPPVPQHPDQAWPSQPMAAQPMPAEPMSAPPVSSQPGYGQPVSGASGYGQPASGYGQPGSATPSFGQPVSATPAYGQPVSATPTYGHPVSGVPGYGQPVSAVPAPVSGPAGPYPPVQYGYTQPRKNSRTVLIACLSVLVLALLVGGGVIAYTTLKGKPTVTATATPSPAPTGWTSMVGGSAPGLEPPAAGGYPSAWSTFGATDRPVAVPSAVDLGFDFKVPAGWKCQLRTDQPADLVLYTCADRFQAEPVEAEIEVQACPPGCTEQMRTDLRAKQPAWGLQWNLSGPNTVRVTSEKVPGPNGTTRYGIVLIRYWSSVPSGPVDRQVVVRLAGPISQANALQKVGHSVWSAVN